MNGERSTPATPKPATARSATSEPRKPYHLGVAIGVTTGAYALSLLATSSLQIQHDRALIADRHPVVSAIDVLGSHHDEMESRLEWARARYTLGADGYGALIARLDTMHERLAKMDRTVAGIERASGALAARIPGVPNGGGGSGHGAGGGSGGGSGSTSPRTVPAAPAPVAQPPVSGSTGASGAP